jgi:formate dehydrogenase major subunit
LNVLTGSHADTPACKKISVRLEILPDKGINPLQRLNFRFSGLPTPQTGVEVERKWKRHDYRMPGSEALVQIQTNNHAGG